LIALRITLPLPPGELPEPGDLWRVASVDPERGELVLARVEAPPGQFRSPRDGLHPRVPRTVSVLTRAEVDALNASVDAAMSAHGRAYLEEARRHNQQMQDANDRACAKASPFADLDSEVR
jgi:hypothetical protein